MRQDLTDITMVLDRSGSMASVRTDTIGGVNTFLAEQRKAPGNASFTLVQFDDRYEFVHNGKPIKGVPDLTTETFVPRGKTALLDAVGRAINETGKSLADIPEADRPGKVLFIIVTDGQENASVEFNRDQVLKMISHQREAYQWEFVFLGANQDAIKAGGSIGVSAANSMTYANNALGTQSAFASTSSNTTRLRSGGSVSYSQADRDAQKAAGAVK